MLKQGQSTPIKINGINGEVNSIIIDNDDNACIIASNSFYNNDDNNFYVLKQGTDKIIKIDGINEKLITSLNILYNGNVYIGTTNNNVNIKTISGYLYTTGPKKYNAYILKQVK